jgi:hypothetical protein
MFIDSRFQRMFVFGRDRVGEYRCYGVRFGVAAEAFQRAPCSLDVGYHGVTGGMTQTEAQKTDPWKR